MKGYYSFSSMSLSESNTIILYGAPWCVDCNMSKKFLDEHGVEYEYINLEEHPEAADKVVEINKGYQSIPTIVFPDGTSLTEPSNEELAAKLGLSYAE